MRIRNKRSKRFTTPIATLLLCLLALGTLAACGGSGGGSSSSASKLSGKPEAILDGILEAARSALPEESPMPMSFTAEVSGETSQNQLGLSAADFDKYVSSASVATALIATFAHEISIVEAKDAAAATEVKKLIAGDGGYDSRKWICVFPEESCVVESGKYVLLAVSRADVVAAVLDAFTEAAGSTGEPHTFFNFDGGAIEGLPIEGGGGMGISIGGGPAPL